MRVLITVGFLGHFGETDGVVTTYRNLIPRFVRWNEPVDIVAYGPVDRVETVGRVRLIVHRPRLPLRVDPNRWVDLAFATTRLARELDDCAFSPDWRVDLGCRSRARREPARQGDQDACR